MDREQSIQFIKDAIERVGGAVHLANESVYIDAGFQMGSLSSPGRSSNVYLSAFVDKQWKDLDRSIPIKILRVLDDGTREEQKCRELLQKHFISVEIYSIRD